MVRCVREDFIAAQIARCFFVVACTAKEWGGGMGNERYVSKGNQDHLKGGGEQGSQRYRGAGDLMEKPGTTDIRLHRRNLSTSATASALTKAEDCSIRTGVLKKPVVKRLVKPNIFGGANNPVEGRQSRSKPSTAKLKLTKNCIPFLILPWPRHLVLMVSCTFTILVYTSGQIMIRF